MQEQSLNELVKGDMNIETSFSQIITQNAAARATNKIAPDARDPTQEELKAIGEWMAAYKKKNKKASDREIKRAAKRHFNIVTY